MATLFKAPDEKLIQSITERFPCREKQIRALTTLLSPSSPRPKNLVLHGLTATGKSSICHAVLDALAGHDDDDDDEEEAGDGGEDRGERRNYAIIKSQECITSRHLLERTVGEVAKAVGYTGKIERCEDVGRLVGGLERMLGREGKEEEEEEGRKGRGFTLVFDGVDRQREGGYALLPALGRLSEVIPNLTTVFIVTSPRPHFLHTVNVVYIAFPAYTKPESLLILSLSPPPLSSISHTQHDLPPATPEQLKNLYTRYLAAVWDTFTSHSGRDLLSFRHLALKLWPAFVAPVQTGNFLATDFQRLFISQRSLFRDESILVPSIIMPVPTPAAAPVTKPVTKLATPPLPYTSQILLLAAYLCSYIPSRLDITIFSKLSTKRRRRGGGATNGTGTGTVKGGGARKNKNALSQRRRIERRLLGPQAFVVERLLAVFWCVWEEASHAGGGRRGIKELGGSADVLAQVATLVSLRLLVRTGREEAEGGKVRVNVGWEVVRGVGRGVGVEVGEWLDM